MKTLLASLIVAAFVTPAAAGPDFTSHSPHGRPLAASPASSEIGPFDDVVFAHDSTVLTDSSMAQLESAAKWLRSHPRQRVVLEGYADATGLSIYNEDLATRRAFVVRQALVGHGISADRIVLVTYGEAAAIGAENPLDRRVILYATKLTPQKIAAASIDHKHALAASWTSGRAIFTETRGMRDRTTTVIGTR